MGGIDYRYPCYINRCKGLFVKRTGKYGDFYGCSEYPKCHATRRFKDVQDQWARDEFGDWDDDEETIRWDR